MMHRLIFMAVAFLSLVVLLPASAEETTPARYAIELEAGPVWQSRNDVQIPNTADGTRFSLVDLIGTGPVAAVRAYLYWNISDRQQLRLLLAPLSIEANGNLDSPVEFAGSFFGIEGCLER